MNRFFQIFSEGFSVLEANWQLVLMVLSLILVSQLILYDVLRSILGTRLRTEDYFSLSMAGWLLPASVLAMHWYGLRSTILPRLNGGSLVVLLAVVAMLLFLRVHGRHAKVASHSMTATLKSNHALIIPPNGSLLV